MKVCVQTPLADPTRAPRPTTARLTLFNVPCSKMTALAWVVVGEDVAEIEVLVELTDEYALNAMVKVLKLS